MSHRILSGHVFAMLWCIVAAKGDLFGRSENVPVLGSISERRYEGLRDLPETPVQLHAVLSRDPKSRQGKAIARSSSRAVLEGAGAMRAAADRPMPEHRPGERRAE